MELSKIIEYIEPLKVLNPKDVDIKGISYNSKTINSHEIFVCLKGEHVDGHDFAQAAFEKGAIAIMCEHPLNIEIPQLIVASTQEKIADLADCFYRSPSKNLNLIGVTGTNGKTSVTHLIQKILEHGRKKCAIIGTLGYKLSTTGEYFEAKHTTPQAPELQATLDKMLQLEINNVVMEVSSHALDQHRVGKCVFKGGVFTNFTQDHLDYHITMENYFQAKLKLFKELQAGSFAAEAGAHGAFAAEAGAHGAFAIVNNDDPAAPRIVEAIVPDVKILTYGIKKEADIRATDVEFGANGANFKCTYALPDGTKQVLEIQLYLNGLFSVYNALCAISTCLMLGVSLDTCKEALEETKGVAGRFEIINANPMVIVDYAHTPDGLDNILRAARELTPKNGELICLFGCGGDRDPTKRPKMGKIAQDLADKIVITSDNPRSEDPKQIVADILAGLKEINPKTVFVELDRRSAIELLKKISCENDVIIVAGKGHEDYQILSDRTIHFDDREEVAKVFGV